MRCQEREEGETASCTSSGGFECVPLWVAWWKGELSMARAPPSHRQRRCNHLPPAVPAVAAAHRNVTAVTRCSRRKSPPPAFVCLPQQQNLRVRRRHCIRDTLPARATQRGATGRHAASPAPHLCWCRARCHRACVRAAHAALRHSPHFAAKQHRVCRPRRTTGPDRGWDPIGAGAGYWSSDWGTHRVVPLGGWPAPPK